MIGGFGGPCPTCGALPGHQRPGETASEGTVYVAIGNSDDRLGQSDWADFYRAVDVAVGRLSSMIYGRWVSEPTTPYQNACWAFEVMPEQRDALRNTLVAIADKYGQESVAWSRAPTEFLTTGR